MKKIGRKNKAIGRNNTRLIIDISKINKIFKGLLSEPHNKNYFKI